MGKKKKLKKNAEQIASIDRIIESFDNDGIKLESLQKLRDHFIVERVDLVNKIGKKKKNELCDGR